MGHCWMICIFYGLSVRNKNSYSYSKCNVLSLKDFVGGGWATVIQSKNTSRILIRHSTDWLFFEISSYIPHIFSYFFIFINKLIYSTSMCLHILKKNCIHCHLYYWIIWHTTQNHCIYAYIHTLIQNPFLHSQLVFSN